MCKLYLQHASFKIKWHSFRIVLFILLTGLSAQTLAQALRLDHGTGHIVGGGVTYNTNHQLLKYAVPRMPGSQRMTISGISVYALAHNQRVANTKVMVSVATGQISIGKNGKKSRQLPLQGSIASINNQLADLHFFADGNTGNQVILTLTSAFEHIKVNRSLIAPAVINANLDEDIRTTTGLPNTNKSNVLAPETKTVAPTTNPVNDIPVNQPIPASTTPDLIADQTGPKAAETITIVENENSTFNQGDTNATNIDSTDDNLIPETTETIEAANAAPQTSTRDDENSTLNQGDANATNIDSTDDNLIPETTEIIEAANAAPQTSTRDDELVQTKSTTLAAQQENRAPTQTLPMDAIPGVINGITKFTELAVNDADANNQALSVSFTAGYGHFTVTNTAIEVRGNHSNDITITASLNALLSLFSQGQVEYHTPHDISGDITITMITSDNGNTGVGGAKVAQDEFTINLNQLNLANVNEKNGLVITGPEAFANIGRKAQALGDINGDGYQDIAISLINVDSHDRAYILFGSDSGFTTTHLNGHNGFIINGSNSSDSFGHSVSSGDINNDGKDDIIIGAYQADKNGENSGTTYVIFGQNSFPATLSLNTLNGQNGFRIDGQQTFNYLGYSVSSGDINNDGNDDIIIGAYYASQNGPHSGTTYVIFGQTTFPASFSLDTLNGQNGVSIYGEYAHDYAGKSVSSGDINNDGNDDIIIGAYGAYGTDQNNAGAAYVVFGQNSFPATLSLSTLNGQNGVSIYGEKIYDLVGSSVSSGDINNDGKDDIIIGAEQTDQNGDGSGTIYVVFGQTTFPTHLPLSTLNGQNGFRIDGETDFDSVGRSVSSGDINNDGNDDIIIGISNANQNGENSGATYVIFGQTSFPASLPLSPLNGQNGISIYGEKMQDYAGSSISSGDINNDGNDDIIIGAPNADTANTNDATGKVYIVYGQRGFGRQPIQ